MDAREKLMQILDKPVFPEGKDPLEAVTDYLLENDVVPVTHAWWEQFETVGDLYGFPYYGIRCSNCKEDCHDNPTKYCPNCGAKMDGDTDD